MKHKRFTYLTIALLLVFGVAGVQASGSAGDIFTITPVGDDIVVKRPGGSLGLSWKVFYYEQTFGETEVAYLDDHEHLYNPYGVGLDGADNLWVAEELGARALKYSADGSFLMSIGTAGLWALADETHFSDPVDAAVDSEGNLWVVDWSSQRAVKYEPEGNYLMQL